MELEHTVDHDDHPHSPALDWWAIARLGAVASTVAAIAAASLHGIVADTSIIVSVIVASTMASWFQLERGSTPTTRH